VSDESLQEALAERNRLWEELRSRDANEQELEYWRKRAADMEGSLSWQLTAPLRLAVRAVRDPVGTLRALVRRLRSLRGG
jgi:hypothetical protein